jgi:hypothetical protein
VVRFYQSNQAPTESQSVRVQDGRKHDAEVDHATRKAITAAKPAPPANAMLQ